MISIPSPPLNEEALLKVLLHLPIQSLFRFRATCQFWREVIDTPLFRNSHVANNNSNNDNEDDKVVLVQLKFFEKSVILLNSGKPSDGFPALHGLDDDPLETESGRIVTSDVEVVGPVNGLICIYNSNDIIVCNPSLGEVKILPPHQACPLSDSLHVGTLSDSLHVGIGLEDGPRNYKVVQLQSCNEHRCLHASMYSKTTNSWRDLANDGEYLRVKEPIKFLGRNRGEVLLWRAVRVVERWWGEYYDDVILSFETKEERFRVFENREYAHVENRGNGKIYVRDEKFVLLIVEHDLWMKEYEARQDGNSIVGWDMVKDALPIAGDTDELRNAWWDRVTWWNECVIFDQFVFMNQLVSDRYYAVVLFYNYDDEKLVESFKVPDGCYRCKFFEYKGSFVLP